MTAVTKRRPRRSFGKILKMRSGRYQAGYTGPDGLRYHAPETYSARGDAEGWLSDERRLIEWGQWVAPPERGARENEAGEVGPPEVIVRDSATLDEYAREWIESRVTPKGAPLHPRTKEEYRKYLDGILATVARRPIVEISPADVAHWHAAHAKTPSLRHKAYSFMKSVLNTAVEVDELIVRNPCRVENASRKPRSLTRPDKTVKAVDHEVVRTLADLVQPRDKALILLLAYCCVRTGEACSLRRDDVKLGTGDDGVPFGWLTVERGVSSYDGQRHEGVTKTDTKGERVVPIPPHIVHQLAEHVDSWAQPGENGLLFPSTNPAMAYRTTQQINGHAAVHRKDGTVRKKGYGWYHARQMAGVPTMHLHWLRHWANTLWDEAGTPEGLRRAIMGHAQQGMTGHYTHPDTSKASPYALRVSELAGWARPKSAPEQPADDASVALIKVLAVLDEKALARTLSRMSVVEVAAILPLMSPDRLAAVLTGSRDPHRLHRGK